MISKQLTEYITKNKDYPEKIEKLSDFIEGFFMSMDEEDKDIKEGFIDDMDEFMCGINKDVLSEIIAKFKHRDGTLSGMKWSYIDVESLAKQYDICTKIMSYGHDYNPLHFWFTMNYVYATHYNPSRTIMGYIELALDEYCNKNVCFKKYMKYIVELYK